MQRAKRINDLPKRPPKDETEKAKSVNKLWERLEQDKAALEKDESGLEKAKTEGQTDEELTSKEGQKKIDVARAENPESVEEAKEKALSASKLKDERPTRKNDDEESVKINATKGNSGQGPPNEK